MQTVCLAGNPGSPDEPKRPNVSAVRLMMPAALSFIVARQRLVLYLVEEAFAVLLGIAVILTLAWITLTAFLLLWQGSGLVFLQLKRIIRRDTSIGDRPLVLHRQPSEIK